MGTRGGWRMVVGFAVATGASGCGDDASDPSGDTDATGTGSTSAGPSSGVADTTGDDPDPDTTTTSGATTGDSTGGSDDGTSDSTGAGLVIDEPLRIAFVADDETPGVDELWFLDEADYEAGPIKLSHELAAGREISPVMPRSSDGTWLVYRSVSTPPGPEHELWLVDVSTSPPAAGVRADETGALVFDVGFSADAEYLCWMTGNGVFSVDVSSGAPGPVTTLNAPPAGGGFTVFELSPVGHTILFTGDPDDQGVDNLYRVPADGTALPIVLSDLTVPTTAVDGNSIRFEPGGTWAIYQADRDVTEPELFWVDVASPSAPIKIHDPLTTESMRTERLSPTGAHVAYWVGTLGDPDVGEVFVTPLDGDGPGAPVAVHVDPDGEPQSGKILFSADGQWLAYTVDDGGLLQSWIVALDGGVPGTPVRVSGIVPADGDDLRQHAFSPTSDAIVYVADTEGPDDLFIVSLAGGTVGPIERVIDPTPIGSGLTGDLQFSTDGAHLLFTGFVTSMETRDVYRVDLSAGPPWTTVRVNPALDPNEEVGFTPSFAGGSSHVLYVAPGEARDARTLYDAPPGGEGFDVVVPVSGAGFVKSFSALP